MKTLIKKSLSKKLGFLSLLLFCSLGVVAQKKGVDLVDIKEYTDPDIRIVHPELTQEDLQQFKISTEEKVTELQEYITRIGDKKTTDEDYKKTLKLAVALFTNEASFQVSSVNRKKIAIYRPIKDYFTHLRSLQYDQVKISFYDLAFIGDFEQGTDGIYYATAIIFQEFEGKTKETIRYKDRTKKKISVKLEYLQNQITKKWHWAILFDDVEVVGEPETPKE